MRVAVASDHAGFSLKDTVVEVLRQAGVETIDYGPDNPQAVDFPDYAVLVGRAIQNGQADRGILICGSGVGMCIAANKLHGVRAAITHDVYSAHQGVEHDGMNVMCLGSRVVGDAVARELVHSFIGANFEAVDRFVRRMNKVDALETKG